MATATADTFISQPIHCPAVFDNLTEYPVRFENDLTWSTFNDFTQYTMLVWARFQANYPTLALDITNAFGSYPHGVIIWSYDTTRSRMGHLDHNTLECDTIMVAVGRADLVLYHPQLHDRLTYSLQTGDYFYLPNDYNKLYQHGVKVVGRGKSGGHEGGNRGGHEGGKFYLIQCFKSLDGRLIRGNNYSVEEDYE